MAGHPGQLQTIRRIDRELAPFPPILCRHGEGARTAGMAEASRRGWNVWTSKELDLEVGVSAKRPANDCAECRPDGKANDSEFPEAKPP
mgnify:FL=1